MSDDKPTVESTFAANLKAVREQQRISQEQLAERMSRAGYSWHQATVYKVESGSREVKLGEAEALSKILGVSVNVLMQESAVATEVAAIVEAHRQVREKRSNAVQSLVDWLLSVDGLRSALGIGDDPWGGLAREQALEAARDHFSQEAVDAMNSALGEDEQDIARAARSRYDQDGEAPF
ncbi:MULTISPECIES: helix-turn-helix domain-containing protein [Gordonia]|uniref:helix-turn-helix domain-containing protein n=1 Tax=Gordonia TaxID=2053 RepID=UPI0009C9AFFF|nr:MULTISPECIES: helix-turn-helix transcriptional regulator [Gordonia]SKZ42085.1 Helix-turn-helix [Mycobacteroides abscessus subsp. abscessus]